MATITANGTRLHVEDTGGPGDPILFLHGFLFDGRQFAAQVDALADRYRCITLDWPGQGRSELSRNGYRLDQLQRDVEAVLAQLDVAPVHLAGLSMGGFVGMRLAVARPDLLRSLILLNTSAAPHARTKFPKQLALAGVARVSGISLPPIVAGVEGEMYGKDYREDPATDEVRAVWRERWAHADRGALVATLLGFMLRSDFRQQFGEIAVPTLIIAGGGDESLPPAQSREMLDLLPQATYVEVPRAGHSSPLEAPDAVTEAIAAFLTEVSATSG